MFSWLSWILSGSVDYTKICNFRRGFKIVKKLLDTSTTALSENKKLRNISGLYKVVQNQRYVMGINNELLSWFPSSYTCTLSYKIHLDLEESH